MASTNETHFATAILELAEFGRLSEDTYLEVYVIANPEEKENEEEENDTDESDTSNATSDTTTTSDATRDAPTTRKTVTSRSSKK